MLQNNDCREVISKCVDGDRLSDAFVCAGNKNHTDILQAFLDHGMNINIKDEYGDTALMCASRFGSEKSVTFLLNQNANPNIQDSDDGNNALIYASYNGYKGIVQLLLNHNVDIDLKTNFGQTALDYAKTEEIKEMIQNHVNTSYVLK